MVVNIEDIYSRARTGGRYCDVRGKCMHNSSIIKAEGQTKLVMSKYRLYITCRSCPLVLSKKFLISLKGEEMPVETMPECRRKVKQRLFRHDDADTGRSRCEHCVARSTI